ncbi:TIGR02391 family protein [Bacteroides reticulotermitis]|uniref:TIGR02391 family protein n=1 Tax=Bacteroides reticulotermitis TaxID=1133319 RepID=UPI003A8641AE
MEEQKLKMSFDPHTIEHLGVKMYSNIPNAIAELIANAYDAEAENVHIKLIDNEGEKSICIIDDGVGMDFDEINNKFLRIGRKKRIEDGNALSPNGKRKVTGKKGLGKLAFFGIGDTIDIVTKKNGNQVSFTLDWDELLGTDKPEYEPIFNIDYCDVKEQGTSITLRNLKRKSEFDKEGLAVSLSKLFNLFDNKFNVLLYLNDDKPIKIDDKLKYNNLDVQFSWNFPTFTALIASTYIESNNIFGNIFSTEKPLKPGLRGITLFANGRLVNAPEFFGVSESSHGFSYFTGWLNVDFVDDWEKDVISTDRQSLNWDLAETTLLREFLKKIMSELERDWRKKRSEKKNEEVKVKTKVDVPGWYKKLPENIRISIEPIVKAVIDDSELSIEAQTTIVQNLHSLIPEYPYYHWRHLHADVQNASKTDYDRQDYYRAFEETVKRYITEVQKKSNATETDVSLMGKVYGKENNKVLKVAKSYKKTDGTDFNNSTIENIEEGQKLLSMGIMTGARNPVAHEEIAELRDSGLFSEKDCLDALSLLSHLFRRLDNA